MADFPTLTAALDARIDAGAVTFIDGEDDERRLAFGELRERALCLLGALRAAGLDAGDYLVLFVDDNARFVELFWAAVYGGIVPVPVAAGAAAAHLDKLLKVWGHLGEPALAADARLLARLREHADESTGARLAERALSPQPPSADRPAEPAAVTPETTAFVQFSSGSTGDPKGVVLTHANICANIRAIGEASRYHPDEVALSWMPLTHDMGLIGFHLNMLAQGFEHHLMRTDVFARRPLLWLRKAAEKRATLLCSPNFGYRHTLRAIGARGMPEVDLSAVRLIYNGAEPISTALAREFLETLAPTGLPAASMFPVYGLAEASLAATFPEPGSGLRTVVVDRTRLGVGESVARLEAGAPDAVELARLGRPIPGFALRLADDAGQALGDGVVGRVQIAGDNVTSGYVDHPEANAAALTDDGWLDTGDLGFTDDGELVITGRAKEIIFINGQNHYPQDLEAAAIGAAGVDLNKVVAVGVPAADGGGDELVLFVLFRGAIEAFAPMAREVAGRVNQRTGLSVARVLPVTHIPKTTSGKLQRGQLAGDYAAGAFDEQAAALAALLGESAEAAAEETAGDQDVAARLKAICDEVVPGKKVGYDDNLFEIGLSSLDLAQIHEGIEADFPDRLDVTDLFDYPTINELAAFLTADTSAA